MSGYYKVRGCSGFVRGSGGSAWRVLDIASFQVKAKKGLLVREGASLDTPEVETLDNGLSITCVEQKTVDGKVRLRLSAPIAGWASKKLMEFECGLGKRPTGETPWLRKLAAPEGAKKRLICFNWTGNRGGYGSSHSFKDWPKGLGGAFEVWEVQMAGRGARMKEPLAVDPAKLFKELAKALNKALRGGPPCVFLGFSFGAIIAAEVASRLDESPSYVVAVSCEGPAFAGRGATSMGQLDGAAFEALLKEKKGTEFILNGGEAMKKMYLPVVKADVTLEEAYAPPSSPLLRCPVLAYHGTKPGKDFEKTTVSRDDAALWLDATTERAASSVHSFDDDWYVLLHEKDCVKIITDLCTYSPPEKAAAETPANASPSYGDFEVTPLGGAAPVKLSSFPGKVHLLFNSASKCGMTPQLEGLQKLHAAVDGLTVLGFPCNQFGKQEPGTASDIADFYATKYGVQFPLFEKCDVNGSDAHPLFKFLKDTTAGQPVPVPPWNKGLPPDDVQWNFTKWLVVDGTPTKRYSYDVTPETIEADVKAAL